MLNKLRVQARSALCRRIRHANNACGVEAECFWTAKQYSRRRGIFILAKTMALIAHDRILQEGEK